MNLTTTFGGNMFALLALVGALVSTNAFAAPPVCTATVPCKDVVPSDCGTAHDELCTDETDIDLDGAWTDSSSVLDCDDANADVRPGALARIGDDLDNDCDGKGDDAELANALVAAGGEASPKGIALEKDILSCTESLNEGSNTFVWAREDVWTCTGLPDGFSWVRGTGVLNETETHERETRLRIAGDRKAVVAAKEAALAEVAIAKADIESAKAAMQADATADKEYFLRVIAESNAKIEELVALLVQYDAALKEDALARGRAASVQKGVDAGQNGRLDNLENSGVIFGIGASAQVIAGRSFLLSEDGPVVRSGVASVFGGNALIGYETPAWIWGLNLGVGGGSTGSNGGDVPVTAASAAVSAQYRVPGTSMAIGPVVEVGADSTGNVIIPQSSSLDFDGGVTVSWSAPNTAVDVTTSVMAGVQNVCYNDFCDNGLVGKFELTVLLRNHH